MQPQMITRINVIDSDVGRRARVSRTLDLKGMHTEIFEDVGEFVASGMVNGLVFLADASGCEFKVRLDTILEAARGVLAFVGYAEDPAPEDIVTAMRAGAVDYLKWPFDPHLAAAVVGRVARGEDRVVQQELLRWRARAKVQELSRREEDVLTLLVHGLANKEMARVLGISPRTVEIHRSNMMSKLGAQSSPDAVRIGIHAGLDVSDPYDLLAA